MATIKQPRVNSSEVTQPTPEVEHTRLIGLRATGPKGFKIIWREVYPDGSVKEEELSKVLIGPVQLLARFQKALAFRLLHAKAWKSWIRGGK